MTNIFSLFPLKSVTHYGTLKEILGSLTVVPVDMGPFKESLDKLEGILPTQVQLVIDFQKGFAPDQVTHETFVSDCDLLITFSNGKYYWSNPGLEDFSPEAFELLNKLYVKAAGQLLQAV